MPASWPRAHHVCADVAVAAHGLVVPLLELVRPSHVDTGVPPGEVVERAGERQGRVRGLRKLDRELEVGIAAGLSEVRTRRAKRRECVGADRVEAELGGHPFSFAAGLDRLAPAAVEHRESGGLPERPRHRSRGRTSVHELDSATCMCVDSGSIAGPERDLRQHRFRFRCRFGVTCREERRRRLDEAIDSLGIRECRERAAEPEEQQPSLLTAADVERAPVEARSRSVRVERERPVSRLAEGARSAFGELAIGLRVVEHRDVVMREKLGKIFWPAECFEPVCDAAVLLATLRARDLLVCDLADERMPERVLRLAGDGAPPLALDELPSLEAVERLLLPRRAPARAAPTQNTCDRARRRPAAAPSPPVERRRGGRR